MAPLALLRGDRILY